MTQNHDNSSMCFVKISPVKITVVYWTELFNIQQKEKCSVGFLL